MTCHWNLGDGRAVAARGRVQDLHGALDAAREQRVRTSTRSSPPPPAGPSGRSSDLVPRERRHRRLARRRRRRGPNARLLLGRRRVRRPERLPLEAAIVQAEDRGRRDPHRHAHEPTRRCPGVSPRSCSPLRPGASPTSPRRPSTVDRPYTTANNSLPIVDATTGTLAGQASRCTDSRSRSRSSPHVLAVLTTQGTSPRPDLLVLGGRRDEARQRRRLREWPRRSSRRATSSSSTASAASCATSRRATATSAKLVKTALKPLGLSLADGRLVWAENHNHAGRLRALSVG